MNATSKKEEMVELNTEETNLISGGVAFGDFWCGPDGCYAHGWWTEFWAYES